MINGMIQCFRFIGAQCLRCIGAGLVLATFVLFGPVLIPGLLYEKFLRKCPRCGNRGGMRSRNLIKATKESPEGKRYPDHWVYFQCSHCNARMKRHREQFIDVDDKEWARYNERT